MVTCEDETAKVEVTLPTTGADGRTIDVVKTDAGYVLEVTFSGALTATVPAVGSTWADLEWKFGDTVATGLPESLTNIPVTLIAEEGATLTLEDNVTMNAVTVQGATLKVAGAYTLAIPAAGLTTTSAISLDRDTTLDLTAGDAVAGIVKAIEGDGTIKVKLTAAHSNAVNFENFTGTTDITAGYFSVDKGTIGKTLKLANGTAAQTTKTTTDATLNIVITGTAKFYANNSFPYTTSGTISGGTLDKQGAATLTVAEATSACAINVGTLVINPGAGNETILGTLSGPSALTITSGTVKVNSGNGNYNGTITINSGATLASGTANSIPFTKGTIVNDGTLEIYGGNLAPVSGVGDVLISGATLPAPITVTGTVTIAADSTATMSENATDYNGAELKIEGGNLQVLGTLNATAGTVTIASGKALSGTGSIEGAITFADDASIDISNDAVTVAGDVTFGATLNVTVSGEETIAGQQILVKADADITEEAAVEGLTVLVNGNEGYYVAQNADGYVLRKVITNPTLSADVAGGTTTLSALLDGNELEADTVLTINFGDGDTPGRFTFDNETAVTFAQITVTGTAGGTIAKSETAAAVTTKLATINTTVTVNAGVATFTVTEIPATGALTVADTTTVAAVTGEGVLAYNDVLPTNVTGLTDATNWTGTLALVSTPAQDDIAFNSLGNASSTVRLQDYTGSLSNKTAATCYTPDLEIKGINTISSATQYAIPIFQGDISGDGTLTISANENTNYFFTGDFSNFTGTLALTNASPKVAIGPAEWDTWNKWNDNDTLTKIGRGYIFVNTPTTIKGSFSAVNGVTVTEAGIISGTGTIASALTLAGGATVDTTSGTLTATNTVTLPSALTVKVAAIPAVGTAVPILKTTTFASNTGAVDGTAVTVKVGDETAEGNYRLVKTPTALLLDNIPAASTSITTSTEALTEIFSTLEDASGKGIQVDLDAAVPYAPGWVSGESYALKSLFLKKRSNSGDAANAETTVTIVDANDTSIEIGTSISCETTEEGYLFTFADAVILDASKTYQFRFSATIGIRGVGVGANQSASLYLDNNLAIVIPAYVPLYTLTAERIVDTSPILSGGDAELEVTTVPEKIRLKTATFGYGSHTVLQYTGDGAADWSQMQVDGLPDGAQVVTTETTWGFEIKTLNVLTVGDSITAGLVTYYNSSANWHVPGGYRLPLYKYLTRTGYTMKYLGSSDVFGTSTSGIANPEEGNPSPSLGENVHHEGHSGARLNQMITRFGNANVQAVLASQGTPDVITLHLGTNDFGMDGDSVENALNEMKSLLYLLNGSGTDAAGTGATPLYPNATIFVAKIIPRADDGLMTNKIGPFNEQLATYVTSLASDKLVLVDLGMANNYGFLRHDGLHPSTEGYAQMAKAWFEAIDTKFDPFGEATAVPTPVASTQTTDVAESDRSGASKTAGVLKAAEWTDFTGFATGFISPIGYMPESERPWQLDVRGANVPSVTDGVLSLNGAPLTVNVVDGRIGTTASTYTVVMTVSDLVAGNVLFTDSSLACTDWPNSKGSTVADLGKLTVTDADTLAWSYNGSAEVAIDLEGANLTDTTPDTIAITITNNQCTVAVNGGTPVTISAGTGVDESYRGNFSIGAMSTAETGSSMKLYRLSFYEGAATVIMPTTEGIINVGSGDDQYTSWSTAQLAFGFGNSLESLTINFTADAQTFDFDNAEALSLKQVTITGVTGGTITKTGAGMVTATAATIDTGVTVNGVQLASTVINENASLAITDYAVLSGSVTGSGELSITGATLTEPLSKKLVADTWTGMVVLTDVEDSKLDLAKLVNAESSLTLNGYVKVYVYDCTVKQLTLNGSFEGINGTSNSNLRQTMIITELVGAGTLYGHKTSGGNAAYVRLGITSADQFTGVVDLSAETATGTTVCFGDIATRDGAIVFSDNADATIPEGKTWKAVNGVLVWATGTISGTGTIGCDLVCESTATSTFNGTLTGDLAVTTGTLTLAKANVLTDVTVTGAANKKAVLILSDGTTICGLAKIGATEDYGENAATLTLDGAVTLLSDATMTLQRRATLDATTHVRSMLTVATGATIRGDAQRLYEILCPITFAEGAIIDTATYAKTANEANAPFTYYGGSSNIHFPEDGHVIVKIAYNNTFFSIYTQMGGAYEGLTAIEWASCVTCQRADGSFWPTENVYFVTREKYRMFDVGFQEANINGASNELEAYAAKLAYELKIYPSIQGNVTAIDNIEYDTCFTDYGASNLVEGVLSLRADFGVSNVTVVGDQVAIAVKVENGSGQAAYLRDTTVIQLSTDDGEYTEITALTDADLTNAGLSNADGLYWYWAGSLANGTGTTKYTVKAVNTSGE
ncbi:MAG: hypothetical protein IJV69_00835 [Kiritimatiellae bacterium]|nr:hypothetical protein [Kiritimatiellia bacterium]